MAKIHASYHKGKIYHYYFWCPGCETYHVFGKTWDFNNDMENPTVSPSILVTTNNDPKLNKRCHSFIKNGKIQFLNDCHHKLKGQTVELGEVNEENFS